MQKFSAKFGSRIQGVISGADRLVFRGSLRAIQYKFGLMGYLWHKQVPLTGFGKHAEQLTKRIKEASLAEALHLQRPVQYLTSSKTDKKTLGEQIAYRDGVEKGLICVLSCVEPCLSFEVGPNAEEKKLELKQRLRKCLFLYHYWMHPLFGFMSARIQTWFPISNPDLPQRPGMAGTADEEGRDPVRSAGELFSLDRRLSAGASAHGRATKDGLAAGTRDDRPSVESVA
jgi:hypothetical protein